MKKTLQIAVLGVTVLALIGATLWFGVPRIRGRWYINQAVLIFHRSGDLEKSLAMAEKAWEAYPDYNPTGFWYGRLLLDSGLPARAIPPLQHAFDFPDGQTPLGQGNILLALTEAYFGLGQYPKAFDTIQMVLQMELPSYSEYILSFTANLFTDHFYLSQTPTNEEVRGFVNSQKLYDRGEYTALLTLLEAAPPLVFNRFLHAQTLAQLGQRPQARLMVWRALAETKNLSVVFALCPDLREHLDLFPDLAQAQEALELAWQKRGVLP